MDLFVIAVGTRSLRERWAANRGDWQTVDRLRRQDGYKPDPVEFTPFRLDLVRSDCARWAERQKAPDLLPRPGLSWIANAVSRLLGPRRQPAACRT